MAGGGRAAGRSVSEQLVQRAGGMQRQSVGVHLHAARMSSQPAQHPAAAAAGSAAARRRPRRPARLQLRRAGRRDAVRAQSGLRLPTGRRSTRRHRHAGLSEARGAGEQSGRYVVRVAERAWNRSSPHPASRVAMLRRHAASAGRGGTGQDLLRRQHTASVRCRPRTCQSLPCSNAT